MDSNVENPPVRNVHMAGLTNKGLVRDGNEDSLYFNEEDRILIVCDGMGGHAGGHVASELAVNVVSAKLRELRASDWFDEDRVIGHMQAAVFDANDNIMSHAAANSELFDMGTTICALAFMHKQLIMGHVGDSRIYRISSGMIEQVSEDHSLVAERVRAGELDPNSEEAHMLSSILTRALGMEHITVDIIIEELIPGDIYIVCSDGLTDMISDLEIQSIVNNSENLQIACMQWIELANRYGGVDNITVAMAKIE